jgi:hypothetical protein
MADMSMDIISIGGERYSLDGNKHAILLGYKNREQFIDDYVTPAINKNAVGLDEDDIIELLYNVFRMTNTPINAEDIIKNIKTNEDKKNIIAILNERLDTLKRHIGFNSSYLKDVNLQKSYQNIITILNYIQSGTIANDLDANDLDANDLDANDLDANDASISPIPDMYVTFERILLCSWLLMDGDINEWNDMIPELTNMNITKFINQNSSHTDNKITKPHSVNSSKTNSNKSINRVKTHIITVLHILYATKMTQLPEINNYIIKSINKLDAYFKERYNELYPILNDIDNIDVSSLPNMISLMDVGISLLSNKTYGMFRVTDKIHIDFLKKQMDELTNINRTIVDTIKKNYLYSMEFYIPDMDMTESRLYIRYGPNSIVNNDIYDMNEKGVAIPISSDNIVQFNRNELIYHYFELLLSVFILLKKTLQ